MSRSIEVVTLGVTATSGILVPLLTLVLERRQRVGEVRVQSAALELSGERTLHRAVPDENYVGTLQTQDIVRSKRSYKAIAAVVLGIFSVLSGLLSISEHDESAVGAGIFYVALALVFGLWARRDLRANPLRRGRAAVRVGIGTAIAGALLAFAGAQQLASVPQDTTPRSGTELTNDSFVLDAYFTDLQQRCAAGLGPGTLICQAAFDATGQQNLLQSSGWLGCRTQGTPADECVALLP